MIRSSVTTSPDHAAFATELRRRWRRRSRAATTVRPGESVQAAVDAASPGDTIEALPGALRRARHVGTAACITQSPSSSRRRAAWHRRAHPARNRTARRHPRRAHERRRSRRLGRRIRGSASEGFAMDPSGCATRTTSDQRTARNNLHTGIRPTLSANGSCAQRRSRHSAAARWVEAAENVARSATRYPSPSGIEVSASNDALTGATTRTTTGRHPPEPSDHRGLPESDAAAAVRSRSSSPNRRDREQLPESGDCGSSTRCRTVAVILIAVRRGAAATGWRTTTSASPRSSTTARSSPTRRSAAAGAADRSGDSEARPHPPRGEQRRDRLDARPRAAGHGPVRTSRSGSHRAQVRLGGCASNNAGAEDGRGARAAALHEERPPAEHSSDLSLVALDRPGQPCARSRDQATTAAPPALPPMLRWGDPSRRSAGWSAQRSPDPFVDQVPGIGGRDEQRGCARRLPQPWRVAGRRSTEPRSGRVPRARTSSRSRERHAFARRARRPGRGERRQTECRRRSSIASGFGCAPGRRRDQSTSMSSLILLQRPLDLFDALAANQLAQREDDRVGLRLLKASRRRLLESRSSGRSSVVRIRFCLNRMPGDVNVRHRSAPWCVDGSSARGVERRADPVDALAIDAEVGEADATRERRWITPASGSTTASRSSTKRAAASW